MALLVAVVIGAGTYTETVRCIRLSTAVRHTREVVQELSETRAMLQDAETGQRGFLLTGDAGYRQPYDEAAADFPAHLVRLRVPAQGQPALVTQLPRLLGFSTAQRIVLQGRSEADMEKIRRQAGRMTSY